MSRPELIAWHVYNKRNHEKILESGALLSYSERLERGDTERHNIGYIDLAAGDGQYIFLALYPINSNLCDFLPYLDKYCDISYFTHKYAVGFPVRGLLKNKRNKIGELDLLPAYKEIAIHNNIAASSCGMGDKEFMALAEAIAKSGVQKQYRYGGKAAWSYLQSIANDCYYGGYAEYLRDEVHNVCNSYRQVEVLVHRKLPLTSAKYWLLPDQPKGKQVVPAKLVLSGQLPRHYE